jgi:hypothetical protein
MNNVKHKSRVLYRNPQPNGKLLFFIKPVANEHQSLKSKTVTLLIMRFVERRNNQIVCAFNQEIV